MSIDLDQPVRSQDFDIPTYKFSHPPLIQKYSHVER